MGTGLIDRDKHVLELCSKYRAMCPMSISVLANYVGFEYLTKKLRWLSQQKYLSRTKLYGNNDYIYTTAREGLRMIGSNADVYDLNNSNAIHEVNVSIIAAWLVTCKGFNESDIATDRQLRASNDKKRNEFYADLAVANTAYEYERSLKSTAEFRTKVNGLNAKYSNIIWVVPDDRKDVYSRIWNTSRNISSTEYGSKEDPQIIKMSEILESIKHGVQ